MPMGLRLRTGLIVALLATSLAVPSAVFAVDKNCVTNATRDLNNQLSKAYDDYSKEMQQLADQLNKRIGQGYTSSSSSSSGNGNMVTANQNVIAAAYQEYSYGQNEANNRLGSKVQQAWNSYYTQNAACDPSGQQGNPYQYQYQNQYYNYGNQYQYGAYQYQYQYPYANYNQYYQYQYQYPYTYGTSYNYSYPYNYSYGSSYQYPYYNYSNYYNQYPVQYYSNYGVQYNNNGQYICPQVVMTTLPAGCGYDCSTDGSGCRQCEVSCRRSSSHDLSCRCADSFRPVCGRDGVTYTNECYADCAGVEVRKMNVCD